MPYSTMLDSGHGEVMLEQFIGGAGEKDDTLVDACSGREFFRKMELRYFTPGQQMYLSPYESGEGKSGRMDFSCRSIETLIRQIMKCNGSGESLIMICLGLNIRWRQKSINNWMTVGFLDLGESKTESCSVEADTDASCTCRGWIYQFRYG